jgi:hypothetical protein
MSNPHRICTISLLALGIGLVGCADRQALMSWPDGKTLAACTRTPQPKMYGQQRVAYTSQVRMLDDVHAYALGRMPTGQGGMDEAHQYYRTEQSAHWDLRLPTKRVATSGPPGVFNPPTYQRPPKDQRVTDAVNAADQARLAAEEAKRNFQDATTKVQHRLQEDNQLKDALREQLEKNQQLRDQLQQLQNKGNATPSPSQGSSTDALKQWGDQLNRQNGPSPAPTPNQ